MNTAPILDTPVETPVRARTGTFLVTGAAGFIGSRVCEMLLAQGNTVVGVDNLNDYYDTRLKDHRLAALLDRTNQSYGDDPTRSVFGETNQLLANTSGRFLFLRMDVENASALDRLFDEYGFDTVFHLAARAGVRYSMTHPQVYMTTNAFGTLNVLESLRKFGGKQLILASTSSLYAGCPLPWTEELPVNTPLSPYAASKKAAEMMAYSYYKLYGINTAVLRYFTVFGPAGRPDMSPLRFIKWIDEGKPIELYGDGTQARDFTYVDDVARATISATQLSGYEVVNVGGGRNPLKLLDFISVIEKYLGKRAVIRMLPFHQADIKETWADISKAARLLNWRPQIDPKEGLRLTVDWHCRNRDWLAGLKV